MVKSFTSPHPEKIVFPDADFKVLAYKKQADVNVNNFHEALEIKYYYDGVAAMMIDNEACVARAGNIVVVNPYEIHTNVSIDAYDGKYYLIILDLDLLIKNSHLGLDLRRILLSEGERFVNVIQSDLALAELIVQVYKEISEKKENYKLMVYSLLSQLLTVLLRKYKNPQKSLQNANLAGRTAELIAPALARIFKDYSQPISVEELADACGVSKYHFCRVFKKEMKLTVVEYINNYRLTVAEILLKNEDISTEEIATSCGFNDVSYFYRCYKKIKNKPLKRKEFKAV